MGLECFRVPDICVTLAPKAGAVVRADQGVLVCTALCLLGGEVVTGLG